VLITGLILVIRRERVKNHSDFGDKTGESKKSQFVARIGGVSKFRINNSLFLGIQGALNFYVSGIKDNYLSLTGVLHIKL